MATLTANRVALRLYVTGQTPSAERAKLCLASVCDELSRGGHWKVDLKVIDVLSDPESAVMDEVFATPTVIRVVPAPTRRLFGDLSSPEMVLVGLQIAETPVPA
ncbi:MAG: circadian clock protein KaiB [Alphaproteobacteria bacterium]|nr:circadian clock protein KaiB [Alphaproteobacteria bacterium]